MLARRPVRVGLVGAGFAARVHLANYRRVHGLDVRVQGITAPTAAHARALASESAIPQVYPTVDDLLADATIDLVDLCVPNASHVPLLVRCAEAGKTIVCEKPLTGFFGDDASGVGDRFDRTTMLTGALTNADQALDALARRGARLCYAENWVYSPNIRKAGRLVAQAGGAILRLVGEESHSGTHSPYARQWRYSGGGSLVNKGCHPLGAALHLKYEEGRRRWGRPIRPARVVGSVAALTKTAGFLNDPERFIRAGWEDCEDWGTLTLTFEDDTVAQITAADITLGGIQNVFSVYGTRTVVHANNVPNTSVLAYSPRDGLYGDEPIREKVETTAGWQLTSGDDDWMNGFPAELQDFCEAVADDREPLSGALLARDVVAVCYAAYLSAEQGRTIDLADYLRPA